LSIVILAMAAWWWRRMTQPKVKKLARKELDRLRCDLELSNTDRVRQLSILLRRVCLSVYPRSETAWLTGNDWLRRLDETLDEPCFTEGPGRVLIDAPYQRNPEIDFEPLFALCERWIESLPETNEAPRISKSGSVA
jgi:Domain of unknown function (DUF4381)